MFVHRFIHKLLSLFPFHNRLSLMEEADPFHPAFLPHKKRHRRLSLSFSAIILELIVLAGLFFSFPSSGLWSRIGKSASVHPSGALYTTAAETEGTEERKFIKWVDFGVTADAMKTAFRYDVDTFQKDIHLNWVDLLAFLGAKYGGDFSRYQKSDLESIAERLQSGEKLEDITKDMKYFSYYREAYGAVLDGMVGTYRIEIEENDNKIWVTKYGLKAFHPLAKGFPYSDFDDFGVARSYGFRRQHLGHDMMGQVGTPVVAVETGQIEALGWNQYGGWRIGIRSLDKKRYYYYAHLRKNYPYQQALKEGNLVTAGEVIGYLGRTGYSRTENTNNIDEPHLHFGLQLIFDESQKDGNNEIWISCYELVKFLNMNRCEVIKVDGTKEWVRVYEMEDTSLNSDNP
ncbi:M23 family metallopeptidase [Lachnospiraceae bacterium 62-35]